MNSLIKYAQTRSLDQIKHWVRADCIRLEGPEQVEYQSDFVHH